MLFEALIRRPAVLYVGGPGSGAPSSPTIAGQSIKPASVTSARNLAGMSHPKKQAREDSALCRRRASNASELKSVDDFNVLPMERHKSFVS